jgi:hypothetical protein
MNAMTHEEAFPELAAVALDTASPEIASAVRRHAEACPECGPALAEMEDKSRTQCRHSFAISHARARRA